MLKQTWDKIRSLHKSPGERWLDRVLQKIEKDRLQHVSIQPNESGTQWEARVYPAEESLKIDRAIGGMDLIDRVALGAFGGIPDIERGGGMYVLKTAQFVEPLMERHASGLHRALRRRRGELIELNYCDNQNQCASFRLDEQDDEHAFMIWAYFHRWNGKHHVKLHIVHASLEMERWFAELLTAAVRRRAYAMEIRADRGSDHVVGMLHTRELPAGVEYDERLTFAAFPHLTRSLAGKSDAAAGTFLEQIDEVPVRVAIAPVEVRTHGASINVTLAYPSAPQS